MRKLLLALPLIAGASWAGTTYVSSSQTQPTYDKLLSQLNQFEPFIFESERYDKGFMQSTAITKVMMFGDVGSKPLLRLKHVIDHSPIGVDNSGARIGANSVVTTLVIDDMDPVVAAALAGQDPLTLHTRVDISGNTINELELSSLNIVDNEKAINFGGGSFQFVTDSSGRVQGQGATQPLQMTNADGWEIRVAESPLSVDLRYIADALYSGHSDWRLPEIAVSNPNMGLDISLQDFYVNSATELDNDFLRTGISLSAGHLDAPLPVNSFNWEFYLTGLPIDGFIQYQEITREIMSYASEDEIPENMGNQMIEAYKALLAPGLTAKNTLSVGNDGGDINTEISLSFLGDSSNSGFDYMSTVRDVLSAVTMSAKVDADIQAVNMTPLGMFAYSPPASDFIINDGTNFTADLEFKDLLLYANGTSHDVIERFGLAQMLDQPLDFVDSF